MLYLARLKDKEIRSSYELLLKRGEEAGTIEAVEADLARIIIAAEAVFRDVYALYSDTSPNVKG